MNRIQGRNQRLLRKALKKTRLITSISVTPGRLVNVESMAWEDYWDRCDFLAAELGQLKTAWITLISGGYSADRRREFVRAYFALLRACLNGYARGGIDLRMLRKVVAFETFRMCGQCGGLTAGIFSARNPVYLLSKLARPNAPDDPKYLPLICPLVHPSEASGLYCHYRRISILRANGIQLFVYPPVESRDRPASHSLIGQLFASLTPKTDPWIRERCHALFSGVFATLVAHSTPRRIQLLDIACGSAKTTMTLCRKAFATQQKSFDLTLVDVVRGSRSIANAFCRNPRVFGNVVFRRENLFDWVDKRCDPVAAHFDIALLLRVCDVFSRFRIEKMSYREANMLVGRHKPHCFVDAQVLHPQGLIEGNRLDKIQHSIKRFTFKNGTAFHQFSLADYFKAIHAVVGGELADEESTIYVPLRRFDDDALVLPSGRSLVGQLMTMADHIIVEDADLSPDRLQKHIDSFGLYNLRTTDVTRGTRMRGAAVCVIARRKRR